MKLRFIQRELQGSVNEGILQQYIEDAEGRHIATIVDGTAKHGRLFAAAPALLDALRRIVETCADRPRGVTRNHPDISAARAAIAAATGEGGAS